MAGRSYSVTLLTVGLIAALLFSVTTPLCRMPECTDTLVGSCSDFQPACDDCPKAVVMKHTSDDAVIPAPASVGQLVAVAQLDIAPVQLVVSALPDLPDVTASPPPLDPLGVRLTV